jgi:hypothetical protein
MHYNEMDECTFNPVLSQASLKMASKRKKEENES